MSNFAEILLLLGVAVPVVAVFQRLRIPGSLAYLLVGLVLGPHTVGPVVDVPAMRALAEFGIVFLLFTIGLNFSLPQLHMMRHQVLGLGTAQVAVTTAVVAIALWLAGMPGVPAFVVGAVVAQSSTTIIARQLAEQGEENSRHGRLGLAMSVFQDVTAVPLVVIIPVLGGASSGEAIAGALFVALLKAVVAFVVVLAAGRWLLQPLFHAIAARRSAELFTLTVLLVALLAAWVTNSLGLSLAFGAFLAGMMLGDTEFRHQVEATIRPFRDVLLGLFFVGIGMLVDPQALARIWHWALAGALAMLAVKAILVAAIVRHSVGDGLTAWRIGLLLAVGGEFGFAVLAFALNARLIDNPLGQIVLASVLFSIIAGPLLIRFNQPIASRLAGLLGRNLQAPAAADAEPPLMPKVPVSGHAILCGFGRIGQGVAHLLEEERIPYVALDLDPVRVKEARLAGEPVFYGDASEAGVLDGLGLREARLVLIAHEDVHSAVRTLTQIRLLRPELPVMVRTRDETHVPELQAAGALEVVPETLEASLMIASQALLLLDVPRSRVMRRILEQRGNQYRLMREFFRGEGGVDDIADLGRLRSLVVSPTSPAVGQPLASLALAGISLTALVRRGERFSAPDPKTRLRADDVLVVFGPVEKLEELETRLS